MVHIIRSLHLGTQSVHANCCSLLEISTIGFGDIVPGQSLDAGSQDRLIICCAYMLLGMALVAMCFKLMQDDVVQKARWLGQKIGILGT